MNAHFNLYIILNDSQNTYIKCEPTNQKQTQPHHVRCAGFSVEPSIRCHRAIDAVLMCVEAEVLFKGTELCSSIQVNFRNRPPRWLFCFHFFHQFYALDFHSNA